MRTLKPQDPTGDRKKSFNLANFGDLNFNPIKEEIPEEYKIIDKAFDD